MPAADSARSSRPRLALLATGGTIAGAGTAPDGAAGSAAYRAAVASVDQLVAAVPGLAGQADLLPEQLMQIDSADFTDARLLQLAHREQELRESQLWREEQVTPELPESPLIPPLMAQQIREALEQELPPFQPIGLPRSPIFSPDSES